MALVANADDVLVPLNDVDLLAAQLADDGLDARALHADAGADRIDIALARSYGDLGAFAGFARDAPDLNGAVVDFRNFGLEEVLNQCRIRARNHDLRSLCRLVDLDDDDADALVRRETFQPRLIALAEPAFGLAEFDDDVAVLEALHDAIDDLADMLVVFGVDAFAFGFADLLKDDLLGHLRRDAAQADRGFQELDLLFHLRVGLDAARFLHRDLADGIRDFFDDFAQRVDVDLTRVRD